MKPFECEQLGCVPGVKGPFPRWLCLPSWEIMLGPSTVDIGDLIGSEFLDHSVLAL